MKLCIFRVFGLKMPIHPPENYGLGGVFDPLNVGYQQNPQRVHPGVERRHMTY